MHSKSVPGRHYPFPLKADEDIQNEDYDEDDKDEYEDDEDDYDSILPSHLNVTDKLPKKLGKNTPQFVSSNNLGTSDMSITESSIMGLVPSAPRNVEAVSVSSRSVTLRLQPPVQTNGDITSYTVFFRQEGSQR